MKKYKPAIIVGVIIIAIIVFYASRTPNKVTLQLEPCKVNATIPDSVKLKVYVENSGSMDAYMCPGSELKDAVFDYVSNLKNDVKSVELNYINSKIIPYQDGLEAYIKDLTPRSFAAAGGNRSNTDLRSIFHSILTNHDANTVSVLVSDCILDVSNNASDYFGNCQVSLKNTFNDALDRIPTLGVEIAKLQSSFSGYWYCGQNSQKLSDVKRPYYIWIIGDANVLAKINKSAPISDVIHGIEEYCAFSPVSQFASNLEKTRCVVNHNNLIKVNMFVDLDASLQTDAVLTKKSSYSVKNPRQVKITDVAKIYAQNSNYSHVIMMEIHKPRELNSVEFHFNYPSVPAWVETSNDNSGLDVENNIDKTTGLKYLVTGVAEAYKDYAISRDFSFNIKNE